LTKYIVTFSTLSDGHATEIIEAENPAVARLVAIAHFLADQSANIDISLQYNPPRDTYEEAMPKVEGYY